MKRNMVRVTKANAKKYCSVCDHTPAYCVRLYNRRVIEQGFGPALCHKHARQLAQQLFTRTTR